MAIKTHIAWISQSHCIQWPQTVFSCILLSFGMTYCSIQCMLPHTTIRRYASISCYVVWNLDAFYYILLHVTFCCIQLNRYTRKTYWMLTTFRGLNSKTGSITIADIMTTLIIEPNLTLYLNLWLVNHKAVNMIIKSRKI